jgi:two-component system, cell cycle sensor histidine kinase and response regulator CckA
VRKHEGDLTVQSEPGHGSKFQILLPATAKTLATVNATPANPVQGQGRILVMDDEEPIRSLLTVMLRPLGYEVETTSDGAEALKSYQTARTDGRPFSAVILDLTVPGGMGGRETIERLRKLDPKVRAIVSSGYSEDPVMSCHRDYGFAGMVAKPYRLRDLSCTLKEVLVQEAPA